MVTPSRIVSLVPSYTETVTRLGVGDSLVGVTRYCPRSVTAVNIGKTKLPDLESICQLRPDLILMNAEENRAEDHEYLSQRFNVLRVTPHSVEEAITLIQAIGIAVNREEQAATMVAEIEEQMTRCEINSIGYKPVSVFYPIWYKPWISINNETYIHSLLETAGGINVCANREARYPIVLTDHMQPDIVLLPSEPFAFSQAHVNQIIKERAFSNNPLVVLVDGRDVCWHGSHTAQGLYKISTLLSQFRQRVSSND